jgi:hypothetical protein
MGTLTKVIAQKQPGGFGWQVRLKPHCDSTRTYKLIEDDY